MSATLLLECPKCGHHLRLELGVEKASSAPALSAWLETVANGDAGHVIDVEELRKFINCACGHPRSWHADGGKGACLYGRHTKTGGCTCTSVHARRRSSDPTSPASTSAPAAAMNLPGDLPPLGLRSLLRVVIPLTAWAHSHIGRWARFEMGDEQRATMNLLLSGLLDVHMHAARLEYLVQPKTVAATDGA